MKRWFGMIVIMVAVLAASGRTFAAGTPAGTNIPNQATATYSAGGSSFTMNSNVTTITVAELMNLTATWQDTAPGVNVNAGQANRVTTFRITNTGNGTDSYAIAATGAGVGGDQFDPSVTAIYLDANGNSAYDSGVDTLYSSGTPTLGPDAYVTVFVLSTMPSVTLNDGDAGNVQLTATSNTGAGAPGTVLAGQGDSGVDAIIGAAGGTTSITGTYVVSTVVVSLNKTATVIDQFGGSQPVTGATIRYAIAVTVAGTGTASGVVVADAIPANTTYKANTLRLNGAGLSDAADLDAGDVGGTTPGTVTVTLGNLTSASPLQTITFEVTIN